MMAVIWSALLLLVLQLLCLVVTLTAADDAQQAQLDRNLFEAARRGDFGAT